MSLVRGRTKRVNRVHLVVDMVLWLGGIALVVLGDTDLQITGLLLIIAGAIFRIDRLDNDVRMLFNRTDR